MKETKTETTGLPVSTDVSSHITETYSGTSRLGGPAASSATKELDDLMASLSDFKVCQIFHSYRNIYDDNLLANGNISCIVQEH